MAAPLAGHTNSYHTYGLDEALAGIAAAGFRGVELSAVPGWTQHLDLSGTEEIRRTLARHGLTAVSLSAHSDLTTREGLQHGVKAVRWAADAGIPIVNTAIGGHASQEENERSFLDNVGKLADAAEAARVIVALEIHGDIMATGEKTLALLRKIGRPNVIKVNYDTGNVEYYGGVRAVDDLPKIAPYVAHVHLKDTMGGRGVWDFPALGSGTVDFARVLEILRRADYTGPYSVELEFQGEPWPSLAEVTAAMRRSYAHLRSLGLP
ncbi:MAG: sugar phosphate isomerase/epimerase [Bacillati bacterium ANGP1]|uniref:Sugar phosphate isomerase/epimerase n=1 Tax=Candidatus Segetimicrobium genomatis TaxID=2569760 RepID=A0A537J3S7_9BACT|nr:MAG: sugar phosphate isomerase/epimerase [Terrabacteria group bacterium ANGP1]